MKEESAYGRPLGSGVSDHETSALLGTRLPQDGEHLRRWPSHCLKKSKATPPKQCPLPGSVMHLSKLQAAPSEEEALPKLHSSEDVQ